jgi:hypothetical protein
MGWFSRGLRKWRVVIVFFFFLISHSLDGYLTANIRFSCAVRAGTRVESLQQRL